MNNNSNSSGNSNRNNSQQNPYYQMASSTPSSFSTTAQGLKSSSAVGPSMTPLEMAYLHSMYRTFAPQQQQQQPQQPYPIYIYMPHSPGRHDSRHSHSHRSDRRKSRSRSRSRSGSYDRRRSTSRDRTRYKRSRSRSDSRKRYRSRSRSDSRNRPQIRERSDSRQRYRSRSRSDSRNRPQIRERPDSRQRYRSRSRSNSRNRPQFRERPDSRNRPQFRERPDNIKRYRSRSRSNSRNRYQSRGRDPRDRNSRDTYNEYKSPSYKRMRHSEHYKEPEEPMRPEPGEEIDTVQVMSGVEAAHVIGKDGRCKRKISRLANVRMQFIDRPNDVKEIVICGFRTNITRAKKYIRVVCGQLDHSATLTEFEATERDTTLLRVPSECAQVKHGSVPTLSISPRELEDEHNVIIATVAIEGTVIVRGESTIAIFGDRIGQRRAELSIMRIVEGRRPGFYTPNLVPHIDPQDNEWGTDIVDLGEGANYVQGKRGCTRKKVEAAAGCVLGIVGSMAVVTGNGKVRSACRDYMQWILDQRFTKNMDVPGIERRDDVDAIPVSADCMGYVAGTKARLLCNVESKTNTFCFISRRKVDQNGRFCSSEESGRGSKRNVIDDDDDDDDESDVNSILIFSTDTGNRKRARIELESNIRQKAYYDKISIRKFDNDENRGSGDDSDSDSDDDMSKSSYSDDSNSNISSPKSPI